MIWQQNKEELCIFEAGKINTIEGIKVIGVKSLMNSLPLTASSLYAKFI